VTPLPELLARAAGAEPAAFDTADVRARFLRRQRRQGAVLAAAVVLVALALAAGAIALAGNGSEGGPADRPTFGPLTAEELGAAPWVLTDQDGAAVDVDVAVSVTLVTGGQLRIDAGCPTIGEWELDAGRLLVTDLRPLYPDCEPDPDPAIAGVLSAGPDVGRVAGRAGSLELRSRTGILALERADRIGRPATTDDVIGTWRTATDRIRFDPDGSLLFDLGFGEPACEVEGTWEQQEEGMLIIDTPASSGGSGHCALLSRGGGDPYFGGSSVRIVDGDRLVMASQLYVVQLRR
jgi:hypothetical protein